MIPNIEKTQLNRKHEHKFDVVSGCCDTNLESKQKISEKDERYSYTHILVQHRHHSYRCTKASKCQEYSNSVLMCYTEYSRSHSNLFTLLKHRNSSHYQTQKKIAFFPFYFFGQRLHTMCYFFFLRRKKKTNPYMHNVYAPSKRMYWFDGSSIECTQQQQHYVGGNIESRWHKAKLSQSKPGILRSVFKSILDAIKSNSRMLSIST